MYYRTNIQVTMAYDDLPEELADYPANEYVAQSLAGVFDEAMMVGFHYPKPLIIAWYGGTGFNVYDPTLWFDGRSTDMPNGESGEVYHFNIMPDDDGVVTDDEAQEAMERYGFTVVR